MFETFLGKTGISYTATGVLIVVLVWVVERACAKIGGEEIFQRVVLFLDSETKCEVNALKDSGNGLIDPISRCPVSIVEAQALKSYESILKPENFRAIPFHSVGKEKGVLDAYFIEKMEIKGEGEDIVVQNPIIAITKDAVSAGKEYQMILHPQILK